MRCKLASTMAVKSAVVCSTCASSRTYCGDYGGGDGGDGWWLLVMVVKVVEITG